MEESFFETIKRHASWYIASVLAGLLVIIAINHDVLRVPRIWAAQSGSTENAAPTDPEDFLQFLAKRVESENFDCSDLLSVDRYSCLIFQVALGISGDLESDAFKTYYAIEAMNITQNLISSARNHLIKSRLGAKYPNPGTDAGLCIDWGYGICGNHAAVFIALLERIGIEARAVQFFYGNSDQRLSHIGAEANINGWRYFDSTWGAFWVC